MDKPCITYKDNERIIASESSSLFARVFLLLITIVSILIPFGATIVISISDIGFNIGILVSYALFWGIGVFLFRVFLWNSFGQEIITLQDDKIIYIADYRFFKDGRSEISTDGIEAISVHSESKGLELVKIKISNGKSSIETVSPIPINDADKFINEIKTRYNREACSAQ
jgi:hypothetical protein